MTNTPKQVDPLNPRDWSRQPPAYWPDYKTTRARSPQRKLVRLAGSMSETTGPIFNHDDLGANDWDLLTNFAAPGECPIGPRILVHGRVLDEDARPVSGALVECWQANAGGRYRHKNDTYLAPIDPNFGGCGRTLTGIDGTYRFRTVQPGAYPWPNGPNTWRPAHIHFSIFGHSFAHRLITQCYFEGDPFIPHCAIVQSIPSQDAVDGLIARLDLEETIPHDTVAYRFDIVLRGRTATPFENQLEWT
ncbi:protocatechuate 3,4-dioxygenase subunit beta [Phaeobacter sp.]|uniref:protocatechuate 3,4-dioxygenase subunit beta n=1 Tax=Phaeobacter sp. TaxID=1902409 RepID=UPI0025FC79A1|nr:protocatechuate 3,4-dioxygenase subunit beta [Phaeobacter sp.]